MRVRLLPNKTTPTTFGTSDLEVGGIYKLVAYQLNAAPQAALLSGVYLASGRYMADADQVVHLETGKSFELDDIKGSEWREVKDPVLTYEE
jgi:hypothetical protein